jgi:hypothetical protein
MRKLTDKYKEVTPEEAWDITECMPVELFFLMSDDSENLHYSNRRHGSHHLRDEWVEVNKNTRYFVKVDAR